MRLSGSVLGVVAIASSATSLSIAERVRFIFSNPAKSSDFTIPSIHESAIQARRVLHLETIGTLSTIFPSTSASHVTYDTLPEHRLGADYQSVFENRPSGLEGMPIGLMDYYADCEPSSGNPSILAISIATSFKNVDAGSNITMSLRWHPQDGVWRSAANLPRFSLLGHLEEISAEDVKEEGLASCFVKTHPDAVAWLPGNRIHESRWVRLVVEEVYWIGGFGDRAYIGWIPVEEWRNVTKEEVDACTLPGEKKGWKWREWL